MDREISVDTLYGPISAAWEKQADGVRLTVSLPPNVTGTVCWNGTEQAIAPGETVVDLV